ncbi:type II toxin-antitoxin system VapB family antitoxin [Paracoccus sp. CPCC 101403]|uniref:Type II toxin-antitoxin system VapB family antitoxin n=1 Tax=Paracoccus broussonetiae TaxID=3075834 RepID=A0ABU3EIW5_9RHOB|nr:type II toxin-antitoxin system VapB family antitoxin [Paracoccus sp. CPCC 101403]MDT1064189.1 type II toxin-antitoxin system VapB family antitoxin [Paracoccus sp. CPCC 101403]
MAMLIKGEEIDILVARYCAMTGEKNKSEAVRKALAAQIETLSRKESLADRVVKIQQEAAALGFVSTGTDIEGDKAFMDEMWGEN